MGRHKKNVNPRRPADTGPAEAGAAEMGAERSGAARPVGVARGLAVASLLLLVGLYCRQFLASGDVRLDIYQKLWGTYLFIPDALVTDLLDMWVGGDWARFRIGDRLPLLAVGVWIGLAAVSAGALALPAGLQRGLSWSEYLAFTAGLGLQLLSLGTLAIGLAGWLQQGWLMWLATTVIIAAGGWRAWRARGVLRQTLPRITRPSPAWLLVLPPLLLTVLLAAMPPWEFDVREYHLQVPKEWFELGRITFLPHNVYGNMPLGAELHAVTAMMLMPGDSAWWYGALAGKLVINGHTWIAALAIFGLLGRYATRRAAWIGASVYVSTPWVMHASAIGHVEGALAAYYLLSVAALLRGRDDVTGNSHLRWLALAGFYAGSAVACKYTAVAFVVLPLLLAVLAFFRTQRWRLALAFLLCSGVACGPWLAKNWVLAGNPTYPLLYRVFGGKAWDDATNARWREAHGPPRNPQGQRFSWSQVVLAVRDVGWHSNKLSLLLWPLALLGFLYRPGTSLRRLLWLLIGLNLIAWWTLTHRYDRFLVPTFSLVAVLAGLGGAWASATTIGRRCCLGVLVLVVLVNTIVVGTGALTGDNRIFVSLEVLRRDEPALIRTHPAHLYLNDHVPEGQRALVVGDAQVFDLEVPIDYHTCWNTCTFEAWMKGKSREERRQILREQRISHVFIHWSEIARYRAPGNYGFTDYVTRELVHGELVEQQGLLRPVRVEYGGKVLDSRSSEVFEVVDGD